MAILMLYDTIHQCQSNNPNDICIITSQHAAKLSTIQHDITYLLSMILLLNDTDMEYFFVMILMINTDIMPLYNMSVDAWAQALNTKQFEF